MSQGGRTLYRSPLRQTLISCVGGTKTQSSDLKLPHGLVESAQVAVVFGRLNVELPESLLGQLEGGEVEVVSLLEEPLLRLLVVAVDGDLLQDQS